MLRTVTVGLDGSPESLAAAEWAAREAKLRDLPLRIIHVWEPVPEPVAQAPLVGGETQQHWSERIPREAAEGLRLRHPGVEVSREQLSGHPGAVLCEAAQTAELLVIGSRGLSGIGGFLIGSIGLNVVAHTKRPVVLVRAGESAADEHEMDPAGVPSAAAPFQPVVLGLDTRSPDDTLIEFAFDAARRRATSLHAVHGWFPPASYAYGMVTSPPLYEALGLGESQALAEVLRPWRHKFPDVDVVEESGYGSAAELLVDAAQRASLVVVGRRTRRGPLGAHIGHVAHAVLHHSAAPVAVVPHD
ncbi:universal stress protein [Streptomyces sp. TLI_146]|uniref:universal stress protein n=1 Tax=Streptomyces sp. TLI_146 TaxID=1938858 RepID=UPI000C706FB9|nr:universal stress protein [Streptomyces sp. TLI_146]PKV83143.1 nucleotide-binding universal stress UspA family protein [Streptomyces sp. TLI_146]